MNTCENCDKKGWCKTYNDPKYFKGCEYHSSGKNIIVKDLSTKELLISLGLLILPIIPIYIFRDKLDTIYLGDYIPFIIFIPIWILYMLNRILRT